MSKIAEALSLVKGKLSTGATVFGHEMEQIEKALEAAVEAESVKAKPAPKEKK